MTVSPRSGILAHDRLRYCHGGGACESDADATRRVTAAALETGLILLSCGIHGNTIRILVPLTASDALLDDGMDRLEQALVTARL